MIIVNGVEQDLPEKSRLDEFLHVQGFKADRVVVEINRTIVPRHTYADVTIKDGDSLEILNFVSGG